MSKSIYYAYECIYIIINHYKSMHKNVILKLFKFFFSYWNSAFAPLDLPKAPQQLANIATCRRQNSVDPRSFQCKPQLPTQHLQEHTNWDHPVGALGTWQEPWVETMKTFGQNGYMHRFGIATSLCHWITSKRHIWNPAKQARYKLQHQNLRQSTKVYLVHPVPYSQV